MLATIRTVITGDPTGRIMMRRSAIAWCEESEEELSDGYRMVATRVRAESGLEFDMSLRWPDEERTAGGTGGVAGCPGAPPARRLVIILGGQRSGCRVAGMVKDTRGAVVAALSYPYHVSPWPSGHRILLGLHKIHAAILDTPAAIMLALDYVQRRAGMKIDSVDLVGVSLGVPFVCVAGALDERFTRVWSIHGAGQPFMVLEHNLRKLYDWTPLRKLMTAVVHTVASGRALAPERWVARISPRPFLMINALNDARIPRSAALTLFQSAREPKELHWMEGEHVAADKEDVITQLCEMIFRRTAEGSAAGA